MEGYFEFRIQPWSAPAITRLIAIVPAVIVITILAKGNRKLLIFIR
jgi:Mn2+/Fe2+ NRAMP family transporter